jgi:Protein of unknown function (DUF1566)
MNIEIEPTMIAANWDDARLYCFSLNVDGKTGWRLPTINELIDVTYEIRDAMDKDHWYWSSAVYEYNTTAVWIKHMMFGRDDIRNKESVYGRVIAVRDLR